MQLTINGKIHKVDVEDDMPLLWVLRDELGMHGTKYGCGIAYCGACSVIIDGEVVRSCSAPVGEISGEIKTIEGLSSSNNLHIVQQAWIEHQVAQCGYCQSGQIITAAVFLEKNQNPTDEEIDEAMDANLCRCGTYPKIRDAIKTAALKIGQQ